MRKNILILILATSLMSGYTQAQALKTIADTTHLDQGYSPDSTIQTVKSGVARILQDRSFVKNKVVPVVMSVVAGVVIFVLLMLFVIISRRQKRKLKYQEQQAREAKLRLQSIRSQLNPHFVYNALAGIQNLLNKKENDAANIYLTKFSRLSRKVLEDADKDLIPLTEEIGLLDDYLQMEQFRFGFGYTITVDNDIDTNNTEVPTMLVQPFVENAVKHGMVSLKNGHINIRFGKERKNIMVVIEDNGAGFDAVAKAEGVGLSLSKNRISLLNEIYTDTPVLLQVKSGATGTTVMITLNDWLA